MAHGAGPPHSSGRGHRPVYREGGPPSPSGEQWDHQAEPVFSLDSVGLPASVSACLPQPSHPTRPFHSLSTLLLGALLSPPSHQRLSPNPHLPHSLSSPSSQPLSPTAPASSLPLSPPALSLSLPLSPISVPPALPLSLTPYPPTILPQTDANCPPSPCPTPACS